MNKSFLTVLIVLVSGLCSYGQQDIQYTQYMYNTSNINPAYAGTRGALSIFALRRNQWVGIEGAPQSNNLAANFPVDDKIGMGIALVNDKLGPLTENNISMDFSYRIPINVDYDFSFGLKASGNLLNVDFSKLNIKDGNDLNLNYKESQFSPNVGVGFYLHSEKAYIGISAPNLLKKNYFDKHADAGSTYLVKKSINYYLITGYVVDLSENLLFKPSLLTKYVQGAPMQLDLSANFLINQKFTAGLAYRWETAVSALAGFQVNDSWFIGYSYDKDTTKLGAYTSGSHELFLRYEFSKKNLSVIAPIFF
jgi:type IX secretion system PorP/SprF family membrane protein